MELRLYRTYNPDGVNGELIFDGARVCYTIELPWLDNQRNRSCIPEGRYVLIKRWSKKHGWHIEVSGVKNRDLILFHPANDAKKELQGCIAPVSKLTGYGKGANSRNAFEKLRAMVYEELKRETVILVISKRSQ